MKPVKIKLSSVYGKFGDRNKVMKLYADGVLNDQEFNVMIKKVTNNTRKGK